MKKLINIKYKKNNEGFSYVETTVSILIITILLAIISIVYSITIKGLNRNKQTLKNSLIYLQTDTEIRNNIRKVHYPFWQKQFTIDYSSNTITFEYINGSPTHSLITYSGIEINECGFINIEDSKPIGLFVKYKIGDKEYETKELFGAYSYGAINL